MPDPVLALDLGGTKIRAALVTGAGTVDGATATPRLERVATVPTPAADGSAAILGAALGLAEQVRDGAAIEAVGISSAGVIDTLRGSVTHATGSLAGWAGTALAPVFSEHFAVPVGVLNDVHAHGIGEARFGVGRDRGSLLLVAVGTGIGGCHLIGGSPVLGSRGAAGHIGHLAVPEAEGVPCPCGRVGHLEGLASGPGIVGLAGRLGADVAITDGHGLARAAREGGEAAREAYRLAGFATGRALGGLLNVLDAEVVALTGGVSEAESPWRDAVADGLAHDAMDVVADTPVLSARAGTHAALLGAAARAIDAQHPS
ncbi:ROK family protein [Brachybacterium sacelli]|uniref:Glucokinase n=1 Tax=Brachybacterium sacelli TaxID=173364 RepID=A0ABS4X0E5_9MICO|nr:ROK family protein [Brachybacterium sacelli]MBP2381937.1 glucokinase [Brachybacterium sacelli]